MILKSSKKEDRIPSIAGSATSPSSTAVENEITNVINLINKINYDAKISDIENKYITTADYNKFTKNVNAERVEK